MSLTPKKKDYVIEALKNIIKMTTADYKCDECGGSGNIDYDCHDCKGTGEGYLPGSICQACRGVGGGKEECESCHGTGEAHE